LQGSGETHLRCGGKYYRIDFLQISADSEVKEFW